LTKEVASEGGGTDNRFKPLIIGIEGHGQDSHLAHGASHAAASGQSAMRAAGVGDEIGQTLTAC
jgi:hypothetical protein